MTSFSIPWQFDSIPNIGIEYRLGSGRVGSKIIGIDSGFGSIPRVGTVGSGRFLKLEPKPDPTVSLNIDCFRLEVLVCKLFSKLSNKNIRF